MKNIDFTHLKKTMEDSIEENLLFKNLARKCLMVDDIEDKSTVLKYGIDSKKPIVRWLSSNFGEEASFMEISENEVLLYPFQNSYIFEVSFFEDNETLNTYNTTLFDVTSFFRKRETKLFVDLVEDASKNNLTYSLECPVENIQNKIIEASKYIEGKNLLLSNIFMNKVTFEKIEKHLTIDIFDKSTIEVIAERLNIQGHIFSSDIMCYDEIRGNKIYLTPSPDFFGVLPVRQKVSVLSNDILHNNKCKFAAYNEIGMGILYPEYIVEINVK